MTDLTRMPDRAFEEPDCYALIRILKLWADVRTKAGYKWPAGGATGNGEAPNIPYVEMYKSRLLLWLLQGHEPLPLPPPKYMSGPQHAMEVDGYAGWSLDDPVVGDGQGWREKGKLYWLVSDPWTIVSAGVEPYPDLPPEVTRVEYYIVTMPEHLTGTWRIERGFVEARGAGSKLPGWEGRRIEP